MSEEVELEVELFTLISDATELSGESSGQSPVQSQIDRALIDEVWESSETIDGNDNALWRRDENGLTICRSEYGNRYSSFGWEIVETASGHFQMSSASLKAVHVDAL